MGLHLTSELFCVIIKVFVWMFYVLFYFNNSCTLMCLHRQAMQDLGNHCLMNKFYCNLLPKTCPTEGDRIVLKRVAFI